MCRLARRYHRNISAVVRQEVIEVTHTPTVRVDHGEGGGGLKGEGMGWVWYRKRESALLYDR